MERVQSKSPTKLFSPGMMAAQFTTTSLSEQTQNVVHTDATNSARQLRGHQELCEDKDYFLGCIQDGTVTLYDSTKWLHIGISEKQCKKYAINFGSPFRTWHGKVPL